MKIRAFLFCAVLLSLAVFSSACRAAPAKASLTLAQNGRTDFTIVLAEEHIPAEKTAAEQLSRYLQQVTGARFAIAAEKTVPAAKPQILVGLGPRVKTLLPKEALSHVGEDGIVIKTIGNKLILAGDRPRGSLYAVFQFLEDTVGCNWWTPSEKSIPRKKSLVVSAQDVVYTPPFSYREHYATEVQADPVFATIMRQNGRLQKQTVEWGGYYDLLGFVHTFGKLLPPDKYFREHPEWFTDPTNGNLPCTPKSPVPGWQAAQLCLSAPRVVEELTKQALSWIEKDPEAGYISISVNDNLNYCRCPDCLKAVAAEGGEAGPVLNAVNKVAAVIHQRYPHFWVETLAYQGTEKPPKQARPAPNVIIRLAPINADYGHPLDSEWNADVRANLLAWSEIAPRLFVWNYVTNFTANTLPHPNYAGLGRDLSFFADNKVKGVFQQGDAETNGAGDFVQLRTWLVAKLLWNPKANQAELTREFLQGYYGPAAPFMGRYLDLLQSSFLKANRRLWTFNGDFNFLTLDVMNRMTRLFDEAARAAQGNADITARVRRERLSLDLVWLYRYKALKPMAVKGNLEFLGPADARKGLNEFIETAQRFGIKDISEGRAFTDEIPSLQQMFAAPVNLPEFARKVEPFDIIDIQQDRISVDKVESDIEDDATASDGKAVTIIGDTVNWAAQAGFNKALRGWANENWRVYATVRIVPKAGAALSGTAFRSGFLDWFVTGAIGETSVPLDQTIVDGYRDIDLGVHKLHADMRIWFAPTKNPAVEKIFIDRILLVRQPGAN